MGQVGSIKNFGSRHPGIISLQGITNWILEPWCIAGKKFYASGSALYYKGYGAQNWEQLPIAGTNNL